MEAILIAGIAALAAGGYYALQDLIADLGIKIRNPKTGRKGSCLSDRCIRTTQVRVKKVAGMYI